MTLVWGKDSTIGHFSRASSRAYPVRDENSFDGFLASLGDDMTFNLNDVMEDYSMEDG